MSMYFLSVLSQIFTVRGCPPNNQTSQPEAQVQQSDNLLGQGGATSLSHLSHGVSNPRDTNLGYKVLG